MYALSVVGVPFIQAHEKYQLLFYCNLWSCFDCVCFAALNLLLRQTLQRAWHALSFPLGRITRRKPRHTNPTNPSKRDILRKKKRTKSKLQHRTRRRATCQWLQATSERNKIRVGIWWSSAKLEPTCPDTGALRLCNKPTSLLWVYVWGSRISVHTLRVVQPFAWSHRTSRGILYLANFSSKWVSVCRMPVTTVR